MSLITNLNEILIQTFTKEGFDVKGNLIKLSDRPDLSQFQCNTAFEKAKELKQNPRIIAEKIANELKENAIFKEVSVAGPGFINLILNDSYLVEFIEKMSKDENFGIEKTKEPKKIIIDYGGPNVAKPLHVGHLRPAIIGEALKRLSKELGHNVIGDVHLGDWGRPIGIIISEIKIRKPDLIYFDENYNGEYPKESPVTIQELEEIYPYASAKAKEDEDRMNEARIATSIMQNSNEKGHKGYYELWKQIVKVSVEDLKKNYNKLNVSFELWKGESDSDKAIPDMMEYLNQKKLLEESDGATVLFVNEENDKTEIPPLILKTRAKSVTYQTTELATIYQRMREYNPDEIWYVVDARQTLHFTQVFRAAYKSEIAPQSVKLNYIGFGTMNGKDGKPFKTRDGGVMRLEELVKLVENSSKEKMDKTAMLEEDVNTIAKIVADGAIKYADALSNRETDYIFDIDKFTENQGKTGPYILYSSVRIKSLLKKALDKKILSGKLQDNIENDERTIMLTIAKLPDVLNSAFNNKSLTEIADYLFELNSAFNNFYNNYKILTEENKEKQASWIRLSEIVEKIDQKLLNIMAINQPEKM